MDETGQPDEQPTPILPLEHVDVSSRGRISSAAARWGTEVVDLRRLQRAEVVVPPTWILSAAEFAAFARASLPRRHELKTLIKMAGTAEGDERCARAHERLLGEPLPEPLALALASFWEDHRAELPSGVDIRTILVAAPGKLALHDPVPGALSGVTGAPAILAAMRRLWADAVLSRAVRTYATAGLREVSFATLLQQHLPSTSYGLLMPAADPSALVGEPSEGQQTTWLLGAADSPGSDQPWTRRATALHPIELASAGQDEAEAGDDAAAPPAPPPVRRLLETLGASGLEELGRVGEALGREIGHEVGSVFAVSRRRGTELAVSVLSVRPRVGQPVLQETATGASWSEIGLGSRFREPPCHLSASLLTSLTRRCLAESLTAIRCKVDGDASLIATRENRTYLNVAPLRHAAVALPLGGRDSLLLAVGAGDAGLAQQRSAERSARRRSRLKIPLVAVATLVNELKVEHEALHWQEQLGREARTLADLDLALLPNDGITTTFVAARRLLERATALWTRWVGAQLVLQHAAAALIRRRVPEAPPQLGQTLTSGVGGLYGATLGVALQSVAEVVRDEPEVLVLLRQGTVRSVGQLPDGRSRGALGQFLSNFGDMALGAFDLGRPRWSEDANDLVQMLCTLASSATGSGAAPDPIARARAGAAAELARYEPYLPAIERRSVQILLDRCKSLIMRRHDLDRWALQSLGATRRVMLDIDRRLRRIDPSIPKGGAFCCEPERLLQTLTSGRPELGQLIRMRLAERESRSSEPAPPTHLASLQRGTGPLAPPTSELQGIGVSPGVVEGRALLLSADMPQRLSGDEILVVAYADPGLSPLYLEARALIAETGGTHSPAAEVAREYALPAVLSVHDAASYLHDGEPIRVDGIRGTIERLDTRTRSRRTRADGTER